MTIVVDAQLSPHLALWIQDNFDINAFSVSYLGLKEAEDIQIFYEARILDAIIITKDDDFVHLLNRLGAPPRIIWITCGNTSNERMKNILLLKLKDALKVLETEDLVEISD